MQTHSELQLKGRRKHEYWKIVMKNENQKNAEKLEQDGKVLEQGQSSLRSRISHQQSQMDKANGFQSLTRTMTDN